MSALASPTSPAIPRTTSASPSACPTISASTELLSQLGSVQNTDGCLWSRRADSNRDLRLHTLWKREQTGGARVRKTRQKEAAGSADAGLVQIECRALREQGHEVRLMSAQYVKPFVKTNKNDYIDAMAIAEAVGRSKMRFLDDA